MKLLRRTLFGNPVLRQKTHQLSHEEIISDKTQQLIADMRYTLEKRKYGIGLAAPQVGRGVALSVIGIKPTPTRPDNPTIEFVIINPEIIKTYGEPVPKWEGCISFGNGPDAPYAQAMRYEKIQVGFYDETGKQHKADYEGLIAHVLQHEIDHLNGVLFVDRVIDTTSYVTRAEYIKRILRR